MFEREAARRGIAEALLLAAQGCLAGIRGLAGGAQREAVVARSRLLPVCHRAVPANKMGRLPRPIALFRDQRLVDVDAEARPVADAVAGAFQGQHSGEEVGVVEAVVELARRGAGLEPGEVGNGGGEVHRGGGADRAERLWGIMSM